MSALRALTPLLVVVVVPPLLRGAHASSAATAERAPLSWSSHAAVVLSTKNSEKEGPLLTQDPVFDVTTSLVDVSSTTLPAVTNSTAAATTTTTTTTTPTLSWTGAWKFEPGWFRQQHPWLPGFVLRRALRSVLHLTEDSYHQLDDQGKPLKDKRLLRVVHAAPHKVQLVRTEGRDNKDVPFHLEQRPDGHVYYVEHGLGEYRLVR